MDTTNVSKKEIISKKFAKNLEETLKDRKITRNRIKEKTGVNLARYRDCDDMREPTLSSAVIIADYLHMSLDELCGRSKYVKNMDDWNAGEVLSVLTIVVEQLLAGSFNADGTRIELPESNVTRAIQDRNSYQDKYGQAKELFPEKFVEDEISASDKWLKEKIAELKTAETPIELSPSAKNARYGYGRVVILEEEKEEDLKF
ncbi:MAG: hypothetical protein IJP43_09695 [Oscillospiraceae bacterium]|nr:hypothetical protein [Oscillospiraceae bacterium]